MFDEMTQQKQNKTLFFNMKTQTYIANGCTPDRKKNQTYFFVISTLCVTACKAITLGPTNVWYVKTKWTSKNCHNFFPKGLTH